MGKLARGIKNVTGTQLTPSSALGSRIPGRFTRFKTRNVLSSISMNMNMQYDYSSFFYFIASHGVVLRPLTSSDHGLDLQIPRWLDFLSSCQAAVKINPLPDSNARLTPGKRGRTSPSPGPPTGRSAGRPCP